MGLAGGGKRFESAVEGRMGKIWGEHGGDAGGKEARDWLLVAVHAKS